MTKLKTDLVKIWTLQRKTIVGIYATILVVDIYAFVFGIDLYLPLSWDIILADFIWASCIYFMTAWRLKKEISKTSNLLFCALHFLICMAFVQATDYLFSQLLVLI